MIFLSVRRALNPFILSILFTGPGVFALTETRMAADGQYQALEHQFVMTSRDQVTAYCEKGDTLITGECEGMAESLEGTNRWTDYMLYLNGSASQTDGRSGWSCSTQMIHPQDNVRLSAVAKCKRGTTPVSGPPKTKTPRIRGA